MGRKGGGSAPQVTQAPNQVIIPPRDQVLSPGQRMVDDMLSYNTSRQMQAYRPSSYFQATEIYPLNNYQATHIPTFNPQQYQNFYGQSGYGPQSLNSVQPFNLSTPPAKLFNINQGGQQPPSFGGA